MNTHESRLRSVLAAALILAAANSWAGRPLSDTELDGITAGAVQPLMQLLATVPGESLSPQPTAGPSTTSKQTELNSVDSDAVTSFAFSGRAGRSHTVDGSGTIAIQSDVPGALISLGTNAQGNLRALVNINAVNSPVQVLINLNVNISSTVGSIEQLNFSLPLQVPIPGP